MEQNINNSHTKNSDSNSIDAITLAVLFKLLTRINLSTLIVLATIFSGYSIGLFTFGQKIQISKVAIPLGSPFQVNIDIKSGEEFVLSEIAVKSNDIREGQHGVVIRKRNNVGLYDEMGVLVTSQAKQVSLGLDALISALGAAENFSWKGYENRRDFTEAITKKNIVIRTYSDGKKLQYNLDSNGHSVADSMKWIN